jgi:hypothetical protein
MAACPLFRNPEGPLSVLREKGSGCLVHVETFHRDTPIFLEILEARHRTR